MQIGANNAQSHNITYATHCYRFGMGEGLLISDTPDCMDLPRIIYCVFNCQVTVAHPTPVTS